MKRRICILTAGHLATTPRMVKAADAFADEGYDVSVISTQFSDWADEADRSLLASRWSRWRWQTVDFRRRGARVRSVWSTLRVRAAKQVTRARGLERVGIGLAGRIRERVYPELVSAAVQTRPSLIYGGGNAIAATAVAAGKVGVPFAFDLQDFHTANDPIDRYFGVTEKIERDVLPKAALLTGGSRAIADAYRSVYGLDVIPIHNVFPLPATTPVPREWDGNLRLYWFGRSVQGGTGLEETIRAVGAAGIQSELTIRGTMAGEHLESLRTLANAIAPKLTLTLAGPAPPDDMVDLCRSHDVGVAVTNPDGRSEELALPSKALTYPLAGLAQIMTDTAGQHELGVDLHEGVLLRPEGDIEGLALGLRKWGENPEDLKRAKEAAWEAAERRWHWEHPEERGRLLEAIAGILK